LCSKQLVCTDSLNKRRVTGNQHHVTKHSFRRVTVPSFYALTTYFLLDHHLLCSSMDGSSNIHLPSIRTTFSTGRKELPQPKSLPFSIKRQDPIQIRNNSPKPGFFGNTNSRADSSNNDLIQTQSYGLPENGSYKQSIKNSKSVFSSQAHSDPNRRPNSQIARPIFGSHIKVPLKLEENASIYARQSSPLGDQAHIPTFDETEVDNRQYSPPSANRLQQPFSHLIASSTALRTQDGQLSAHSNGFSLSSSSSSHPVPKFPQSPGDYSFLRFIFTVARIYID